MKPLIVGESPNPSVNTTHSVLDPRVPNGSGARLANIMGLTTDEFVHKFSRVNICIAKFDKSAARNNALVLKSSSLYEKFVLLGKNVAESFGFKYEPFTVKRSRAYFVILPHPSGKCRIWNAPESFNMARKALHIGGVL